MSNDFCFPLPPRNSTKKSGGTTESLEGIEVENRICEAIQSGLVVLVPLKLVRVLILWEIRCPIRPWHDGVSVRQTSFPSSGHGEILAKIHLLLSLSHIFIFQQRHTLLLGGGGGMFITTALRNKIVQGTGRLQEEEGRISFDPLSGQPRFQHNNNHHHLPLTQYPFTALTAYVAQCLSCLERKQLFWQ